MLRQAIGYLCQSRSTNTKTGDCPQIAIGTTRAESLDSCRQAECRFLHPKHGGLGGTFQPEGRVPLCYAQHGTPSFAHAAQCKSAANGKDKSLATAIASSIRSAMMVRLGSIGDPIALSTEDGEHIRTTVARAGLTLIGYTHGWRKPQAEQWRGQIMASCDTPQQADEAIDAGWRAAVVLPGDHVGATFTTPAGRRGAVCPAQLPDSRTTCNTCRACDGTKPNAKPIGFIDHSPGTRK